ncbi:MAG: hypothetical protein A3J42_09385 [Candidatus Dadabacteria bacterium RIFCSPHIGHO2_12_FULL_53_21]|nr:MAG: hypothetical protein A3J42_09385 [Candidatus Dadabacteria bacterium RIFCSPHIGHO2_12_FULL_53_21]
MKENHTGRYTAYVKYFVIAALTAAWILAAWTGFMLGVVPYSPGDEKDVLLLGYTRAEWGIIHSWLSVGAVSITAVEILITRKSLREFIRYLTEPQGKETAD